MFWFGTFRIRTTGAFFITQASRCKNFMWNHVQWPKSKQSFSMLILDSAKIILFFWKLQTNLVKRASEHCGTPLGKIANAAGEVAGSAAYTIIQTSLFSVFFALTFLAAALSFSVSVINSVQNNSNNNNNNNNNNNVSLFTFCWEISCLFTSKNKQKADLIKIVIYFRRMRIWTRIQIQRKGLWVSQQLFQEVKDGIIFSTWLNFLLVSKTLN